MTCTAAAAKTLVLTYSGIIFCLGAAALGFGAASVANTTFLAHLVPQETAIACLIAGCIIMFISLMGCVGTCFAHSRKCLLVTMTIFTLAVVVVSVASFVVVFMYQDIVKLAAKRNFTLPDADKELTFAEEQVYAEVKMGWSKTFDACEPTVYDTTTLNSDYCAGAAQCVDLPDNLINMYCRADNPSTLVYEAPDGDMEAEVAIASKGFGWWVSSYCLPPPATFTAAMASKDNATSPFGACYSSPWWEAAPLTQGEPVYSAWAPEGEPFNAKASFCFCAVSVEGSKLWQRLIYYSSFAMWISLALCIFFFLAFLAELYLICCRKKDMQEYYESNKPRDERFIRP